MTKKRLSAAQGTEAACILFELNTRTTGILHMAREALLPEEYLREPGAALLCAEWRAFAHAVVTAGLMQHAPNSVLLAYLRETGNLLTLAAPQGDLRLEDFVDGPFARYMPLLAQGEQARCPELFCTSLAAALAAARGTAPALDARVQARLAAFMALVISAVWDKLEEYEILPD
ncbi:serine/threonine protein kinase [Desulfovibrio legallii]|jgi:hypothetical protein|uniref:Uncharacterized protein n=1 Tax=Desulfovibrio legallii TaxID=571438 RepID=A0A1G7JPD0_9BACT|nr:serine/threonine protein kinase [Desulfovibrio legallii]SDF26802.1 hypothetical protein SAMN05192586_10395 [Desulfovibrio legallii]